MDLTRDTLPDDPEKLKAMIAGLLSARTAFEAEVVTLQAANLDKQARIDRLQLLLKTIQRGLMAVALRNWMKANMLLPLKRYKLLLAR